MHDTPYNRTAAASPGVDPGIVRQLRGLAEEIAAFVQLQSARLEQAAGTGSPQNESQELLERRLAALESREREFDSRQRDACEHVAAECDRLAAAWDELEAGRRQLLARGETAPLPAHAHQQPHPAAFAPVSTLSDSTIDLIGDPGLPSMNSAPAAPWSREPAAQQFQQMKREIRRHARRRKP